jgi:hypothetical protein
LVPTEYHQFLKLFREPLPKLLPPYRSFYYQIQIKKGKEVPFGPSYYLLEKEVEVLREYLDCILVQRKITEFNIYIETLIIFDLKPNGKLQLCVDYRKLNVVTIKDLYQLPLMDKLRD